MNLTHGLMSLLVSIKPRTGLGGHIVVASEIFIVNITAENFNGTEKNIYTFPHSRLGKE